MNLDELCRCPAVVGLNLSADELGKLLPGVNRSRAQAAELRQWLAGDNEPAATFRTKKSAE